MPEFQREFYFQKALFLDSRLACAHNSSAYTIKLALWRNLHFIPQLNCESATARVQAVAAGAPRALYMCTCALSTSKACLLAEGAEREKGGKNVGQDHVMHTAV